MQTTMRAMTAAMVMTAAVAGCGNPGGTVGPGAAQPPPGCTSDPTGISFDPSVSDRRLPDVYVPPPGDHPPPCSGWWLTSAHVSLSAWGTAFPGQVDRRVGVCVGDGTWVGRLKPEIPGIPNCGRGPDSPDITIRFKLGYAGDFDALNPGGAPEACIYRSGLDVTRFEMSGIDALDDAVRDRVKGDVLAAIDREVADQINQRSALTSLASGSPLPSDHDGRCGGDWHQSDLPLP